MIILSLHCFSSPNCYKGFADLVFAWYAGCLRLANCPSPSTPLRLQLPNGFICQPCFSFLSRQYAVATSPTEHCNLALTYEVLRRAFDFAPNAPWYSRCLSF